MAPRIRPVSTRAGIAANATERAVRGQSQASKTDGIYRAIQRRESTYWRERAVLVAKELQNGNIRAEPGKTKLMQTRQDVEHGWRTVSQILEHAGQPALAAEVIDMSSACHRLERRRSG